MNNNQSNSENVLTQIVEGIGESLGFKTSTRAEQKLDERETIKVDEESRRRFSHASKCVWKMDREA